MMIPGLNDSDRQCLAGLSSRPTAARRRRGWALACVTRGYWPLLLLVLMAVPAEAQTNTGGIGGVATDESGGVLPGATVTATHGDTGATVVRVTDAEGRFFLPALQVGAWSVQVALAGFAPETQVGVVLEVGRVVELEFALALGGLAEEVVVEVRVPLLQSTTAEISDVIENREVVQIPINGRNFLSLAQLSDAVVVPPGGTRGAALQQAGALPNVGGQRAGHNIYLLDGVKITDELFNNLVINPSVDSIQEFRIQKSMYPAEFGGKASALVNVVTRAGANVFRGSLFGFARDERFDARNAFNDSDVPVAARSARVGPSSSSATSGSTNAGRSRGPSRCPARRCARATSRGWGQSAIRSPARVRAVVRHLPAIAFRRCVSIRSLRHFWRACPRPPAQAKSRT